MQRKSFQILDAKAAGEAGVFEATVAVFNNVDHGNDRIMPGAFSKSLERWAQSGDPIPVILSHQWDDPYAHIGVVTDAKQTAQGLRVTAKLDMDNAVAKQVHRLLERRSIKEFSIGYQVSASGQKRAKDGANELLDIDLVEVGPTLKGMNPATELHAVKSALQGEEPRSELQEVIARLSDLEKTVQGLAAKSVKPAAPEPDELYEASRQAVEGILLDGTPDRQPPKKAAPTPEPPSEAELKARFEQEMLELLRG